MDYGARLVNDVNTIDVNYLTDNLLSPRWQQQLGRVDLYVEDVVSVLQVEVAVLVHVARLGHEPAVEEHQRARVLPDRAVVRRPERQALVDAVRLGFSRRYRLVALSGDHQHRRAGMVDLKSYNIRLSQGRRYGGPEVI